MSEGKTNINYTAEDILNYHSGKLTAAEMHAMEKAALDDAFLAEAMEGYAVMKDTDIQPQLAILKNHFDNQQTAKVIPFNAPKHFKLWKTAAAIAIIIGGLSITYLLTNNKTTADNSFAKLESKTDTPAVAEIMPIKDDSNEASKTLAAAPAELKLKKVEPVTTKEDISVVRDTTFMYRPSISKNKTDKDIAGGGYINDVQNNKSGITSSNNALPSTLNEQAVNEVKRNASAKKEMAAFNNVAKQSVAPSNQFMAQIVGPDNAPLPFANITVPTENTSTYADAKGNFKLMSAETLLNVKVKSVGYVAGNFTIMANGQNNKIHLQEDQLALQDKTIVSSKASSGDITKRAVLQADSTMNAEPADGWNNYGTYLSNNIYIPNNSSQQNQHGEVGISFDVQNNGAITNIKIDKSICEDCDEEVLRVIKEGPQWKVKKGNKATARLKVKF
ncbi:MAG: carboxypeptidase-like regulatory domain-containing protein [Ferruginibacter sp.]